MLLLMKNINIPISTKTLFYIRLANKTDTLINGLFGDNFSQGFLNLVLSLLLSYTRIKISYNKECRLIFNNLGRWFFLA